MAHGDISLNITCMQHHAFKVCYITRLGERKGFFLETRVKNKVIDEILQVAEISYTEAFSYLGKIKFKRMGRTIRVCKAFSSLKIITDSLHTIKTSRISWER